MYKLSKPIGAASAVSVENTDTGGVVIIGKITLPILTILADKEGLKTSDDTLSLQDQWDITITEETAKTLAKEAMKMKKPIRDQRKTKSEQPADAKSKTKKQPVDVFNLIFGTE